MTSTTKSHLCNECGKTFRRSGDLKRHQLTHSGEKPYKCQLCGNGFAQKGTLDRHKMTHSGNHGEHVYKCNECGKPFQTPSELERHRLTHTGAKPYKCEQCGNGFTQKGSLDRHKQTHSGEKPFRCEECAAEFTQKGQLQRHQRVHTGEKPFVCDTCGRRFSRKTYLHAHQTVHSGEKPYECGQCGKRFTQSGTLQLHQQSHGKARECSTCGKPFTQLRLLREHMLHHTDPDQFKCAVCGRRFTRKRDVREHKSSCGNCFPCGVPGCEFLAKTYVAIEDHRVKMHGTERRLKCPICNHCFPTRDGLRRHERRVHNGRFAYACDKCGVVLRNAKFHEMHNKICKGVAAAFNGRICQVAEKHRIEEDYELTEEVVGQGLSSVFKAKGLQPEDIGKEFAVKKIDVKRDTPVESRAATYRALTEARIAKSRCGHENTAGVEKVYYEDGTVYTVAKLVRPGNLLKAVTNLRLRGTTFGEAHVASIMKDILQGLQHIHGQGLLHRDMKTANVLLGEDGVCMIVDFGESATSGPQRGTGVGTDGYRPPEAWGDEKQTTALDVYPLGIIATECTAMRGAPRTYNDDPPRGVIAWLRRWLGHSTRTTSSSFENFLERCLQHDAAARPSVTVLLEHPFIKLADRSSLKELVAAIV